MLLEGGLIPIRHLIIKRRLNYLHCLLKSDKNSSLAKQVFLKQAENPIKEDFTTQVLSDLNEFEIFLSLDENHQKG